MEITTSFQEGKRHKDIRGRKTNFGKVIIEIVNTNNACTYSHCLYSYTNLQQRTLPTPKPHVKSIRTHSPTTLPAAPQHRSTAPQIHLVSIPLSTQATHHTQLLSPFPSKQLTPFVKKKKQRKHTSSRSPPKSKSTTRSPSPSPSP
jgi:hypothetical protein